MNLGKAIKLIRVQKGMKQSDVAEIAHISVSYLSLVEQGKRDPKLSTVQEIALALNVPIFILTFIASEKDELLGIGTELAEKLSYIALQLIRNPASEITKMPK